MSAIVNLMKINVRGDICVYDVMCVRYILTVFFLCVHPNLYVWNFICERKQVYVCVNHVMFMYVCLQALGMSGRGATGDWL